MKNYNKDINYELSNKNDLNSGRLSFNNLDGSNLKIRHLDFVYVGTNTRDQTEIIANQGVAEWLGNYMDRLNGSPLKGEGGAIPNDMRKMQKQKESLEQNKSSAENYLEVRKQELRARYARANSMLDAAEQQLQMLDLLNNLNSKD